jgi:hypothetical protein
MLFMAPKVSAIVFLAGLMAGEFYLLLLRSRPVWLRVAYFVLLAAGWTIVYYLVEPPTANRSLYPQTYFWYLVWVHTITVAVFAIALVLAAKLEPRYLAHVMLALLALVIALVWPHFVLLSHCSFLECL